jgi:hypothetical protein
MKYSAGMAILYLPAFVFGHVVAHLFDYPVDGFSYPYQLGMFLEMLVVMVLSLWFLRKVLLHFFSDRITAWLLLAIAVGTNYTVNMVLIGAGAATHGYLFLLYALILWLTIRWHEEHDTRSIVLLGLVCGITILSRPSEVVCLLIPLLWDVHSWDGFKRKLIQLLGLWRQLAVFGIVLIAIGSIQFIYWKYVTGSFFHYSYGDDAGSAFNFLKPHTLKVLFSYRKGWFIYTPMMLLATIGLFLALKKRISGSLGLVLYFLLNLWIVSSWHCWWYSESFGQRSLVQSFPIMAIGLGVLLTEPKWKLLRGLVLVLSALALVLNVFQSWQFKEGIIDASRQTKDYYWETFGKTEYHGELDHLKLVQRDGQGGYQMGPESDYYIITFDEFTMEDGRSPSWTEIDSAFAKHGKFSARMLGEHTGAFLATASDLTAGHYVWFRLSGYVYPNRSPKENPFSFVFSTEHEGATYMYQGLDSENLDLKEGEWNYVSSDYLSPEMRSRDDKTKAFVWNRGGNELYLDDFKLEVFVPKFDPER